MQFGMTTKFFQDEECDNVSVNSLELSLQPDLKRSKRTMSRDDGNQFVHATFRYNLVIGSIKVDKCFNTFKMHE